MPTFIKEKCDAEGCNWSDWSRSQEKLAEAVEAHNARKHPQLALELAR